MRKTAKSAKKSAVAVVAGASRGAGRGIALALGAAGYTVYVTARTARKGPAPTDGAPGTVEDTAEEIGKRGGRAVPLVVDHTDPQAVGDLFERVSAESGEAPQVVACAVWGGNERFLSDTWQKPFWEQPAAGWTEFMDPGPFAFWLTAQAACRRMVNARAGLIVAVTEPILSESQSPPATVETFSHLAHYSTNRLIADLARPARKMGVCICGILPGFMRTERVEMHLGTLGEGAREQFRYDLAESTEYGGRAVAALANDPNVLAKSGKLMFVADLAEEYEFTDVGGVRVANYYRVMGLVK